MSCLFRFTPLLREISSGFCHNNMRSCGSRTGAAALRPVEGGDGMIEEIGKYAMYIAGNGRSYIFYKDAASHGFQKKDREPVYQVVFVLCAVCCPWRQ